MQRVARADVVAHPPGSSHQRTPDRHATNVQPREPSRQLVYLVGGERTSTVQSRQPGEDLGIQMRKGDQRRIGVIDQPSTDALTFVTANQQVDSR